MRVIGLMSGTSVDGIDAALVDIEGEGFDLNVTLVAGETYLYSQELRERVLSVCEGQPISIVELARLDDAIAIAFAQAALKIQQGYQPAHLIGSHGQTVYHRPPEAGGPSQDSPVSFAESDMGRLCPSPLGYSLQLGRGDMIAQLTKIPTVSNFRAADIAVGGQGAPLVPLVDLCLLGHATHNRCIQNLGGIGNVAYLPAWDRGGLSDVPPKTLGWDTGPGNMLLDLAAQYFSRGQKTYDRDGAWAATGEPCTDLVDRWLQQAFFHQAPPKSTGRELFGAQYFEACLADAQDYDLSAADMLATLTVLTAQSISHSYRAFLPQLPDEVFLCGGGCNNLYLRQQLQFHLGSIPVLTTDEVGLNSDYKEAIAFALLGFWREQETVGNIPAVTGAQKAVVLGERHDYCAI